MPAPEETNATPASSVEPTSGKTPPAPVSWEEVQRIKAARREAWEAERTTIELNTPIEAYPLSGEELPAMEFQMANGNDIGIVIDWFPEVLSPEERLKGTKPGYYYAIRVFSTEDTLPRTMKLYWEFHPGYEFPFEVLKKIWDWLEKITNNRKYLDFDWTDEFLEEFESTITELSAVPEDAVQHYEHLTGIADPEAFDHDLDDSIYNDQNEPDSPNNN